MDDKKEKPYFVKIAIESIVTAVVSSFVALMLQYFSMESVIVSISPSAEINGQYLTIVSVHNLKKETLSDLSLYFEPNFDILKIESKDPFKLQQQYVELDSLAPKAKYSVVVWTEKAIEKDYVIAESKYKIQLDYANEDSPYMIRTLWLLIPFGILTALSTGIRIWMNWKQYNKQFQATQNLYNQTKKELERAENDRQMIKAELDKLKMTSDRASSRLENKFNDIRRRNQELKSYYLMHIYQLRKELTFWRDTVRKLLYNSQNKFQTADKVIETVTATLKTYTTQEHNDKNIDEMLYLAQLIADSKELHSIRDSHNWEKDK